MTWIVGTPSIFGSSILVSDLCVTFTERDGTLRHVDCLQKIYPLGNFVLGGFAGSIRVGFTALALLRRELGTCPAGAAWNVRVISDTWLRRAGGWLADDSIGDHGLLLR